MRAGPGLDVACQDGRVFTSPWLLATLALLATARLTRLVTRDAITDPPRAWITKHARPSVTYLVHCPWCVSIYLGAGVAVATYNWPRSWPVQIGLLALAGSHAAGLSARLEDRDA